MHIVHVAGALKGGPLTAIAEWTRLQIAAGHRVSLVYSPLRDSLDSIRRVIAPEIEVYPIEISREIDIAGDIAAFRKLRSLLKTMGADVIHLHSSKAGAIGRVAAWLDKIPSVYSPHGLSYLRTDVGFTTRSLYFALEWVLGLVGTVTVACSPSELAAMAAVPGRKIMIPNGIDLSSLSLPERPAARSGLRIALCGRITAQKNPGLACRIAQMSPTDWEWFWLGDGELRDVAARSGRIQILGWMPRTEALAKLGAMDLLAHTSIWEGMPIAVLEAMALGLPIVATNVVGNRDLIVPGETGFVADDPQSFLAALQTLADSKDLRDRMGETGRARIAAEFDQAKLNKHWLDLYASLHMKSIAQPGAQQIHD